MATGQRNGSSYYLLYLFMTGLFLGILFVNIRHDVWIKEDGLLNMSMIRQLQSSELNGGYLFGYIIKHRCFSVLTVGLLASTVIGFPIICGYAAYLGVSAGCMLSVAVVRYGIRGLLLMAASIFPQGIILIPGYILLFIWSIDCNRRLYGKFNMSGEQYFAGSQFVLKKGIKLLGILVIIVSGCAVESYVNPKILQFVIKFF